MPTLWCDIVSAEGKRPWLMKKFFVDFSILSAGRRSLMLTIQFDVEAVINLICQASVVQPGSPSASGP